MFEKGSLIDVLRRGILRIKRGSLKDEWAAGERASGD